MNEPLDELYLTWLYRQIGDVEIANPSRTYWNLAKKLFTTEFTWTVPNDDNRLEDGRDLRYEFRDDCNLQNVDPQWFGLGCSMLEMLVALARRLAFQTDGEARAWFWHLIENLDLQGCTDRRPFPEHHVEEVLNRVIHRTYESDGHGGLFPLRRSRDDQRRIELWYQLNAYILEQN